MPKNKTQQRLFVLYNHLYPDNYTGRKRDGIKQLSLEPTFLLSAKNANNFDKQSFVKHSLKLFMPYIQNTFQKLLYSIKTNQLHPTLQRFITHFYMSYRNQKRNMNMIEILIAISIIVTFSALSGAVFAQVYENTKVAKAKLDLNAIYDGLVMYYTQKGEYPIELEELLPGGYLNRVPKDPWGSEYIYVSHIDWARLSSLLSFSKKNLDYYIKATKHMKLVLSKLPESIKPIEILAIAMEQPFPFCIVKGVPMFPSKIETAVTRDRIKYVATLMKRCYELSSDLPELHQEIGDLINAVQQ